jgi:DNA-binding transcriptional regulator YhcF (GntR family)
MANKYTDAVSGNTAFKATEKSVLMVIAHCAKPNGSAFPSHRYMGQQAGCSKRTAGRATQLLIDLSIVKVLTKGGYDLEAGKNWSNTYQLDLDRLNEVTKADVDAARKVMKCSECGYPHTLKANDPDYEAECRYNKWEHCPERAEIDAILWLFPGEYFAYRDANPDNPWPYPADWYALYPAHKALVEREIGNPHVMTLEGLRQMGML